MNHLFQRAIHAALSAYSVTLVLFGAGIYLILSHGGSFAALGPSGVSIVAQSPAPATASHPIDPHSDSVFWAFKQNLRSPLSRLLIQFIVVVAASRAVGLLLIRCGQPAVCGEIVAGILLGPSFFGWLAPHLHEAIFPAASLDVIKLLSEVGICVFMFVVGMDVDVQRLRGHVQTAVLVSHTSILFPFFLGVASALFIFSSLATPGASFVPFALFLGISMSITAFPVLARILEDRGLNATTLASTAIACAAVDDMTAWSILALIVALVNSRGFAGAIPVIALALVFVAIMLFVVRSALARARWMQPSAEFGKGSIVAAIAVLIASSLATEVIGIHAIFGAFVAGLIMPQHQGFRHAVKTRLESFASIILLPLFFAITGLRTQIQLLDDLASWATCLSLIVVATVGKLGGGMVAARWTGMGWNDAFALGALMNTRGMMELIALNLGLELGILSPRLFAMLVFMALVTTFMTGPLLTLAERLKTRRPSTFCPSVLDSRG